VWVVISDTVQQTGVWACALVVVAIVALGVLRAPIVRALDRWKGATFGDKAAIDLSGHTPAQQIEAPKALVSR
jgi:hypothetical protein